jgi:hypothetical protein
MKVKYNELPVGTRVRSIQLGDGEITEIEKDCPDEFPVKVEIDLKYEWYTINGKNNRGDALSSLTVLPQCGVCKFTVKSNNNMPCEKEEFVNYCDDFKLDPKYIKQDKAA